MQIALKEITIRDLVEGYKDNQDNGVKGYGGTLDIRPPYQREFIYKADQREAVIDTVMKGFPLNVMYWAVTPDGYEIIDGQQRTISIGQYMNRDFSLKERKFHNLESDEKERFLNYELMVYVCDGTDSEKLEWFKTINIAGIELADQELRNAVYSGSWVTAAKKHFSKPNSPAYEIGKDYLQGSAIRQKYLETAIKWISKDSIENYMSDHQQDANADALWEYFETVIHWIEDTFPKKRTTLMKGVGWGPLYDECKDNIYDTDKFEEEISALILDDDVTNQKGIYPYVLTRDENHLNIRVFSPAMKQTVYEKQKGICVKCQEHFELNQMEADHITPWHEGGKTIEENCQMLCREDNRRKGGR